MISLYRAVYIDPVTHKLTRNLKVLSLVPTPEAFSRLYLICFNTRVACRLLGTPISKTELFTHLSHTLRPKLSLTGTSGATMDEVSVTCSPEQITIFMCYSQPALSTTLVISQNQSGKNHGPGYKLRLIEQFLSFSSISSGDAADCTNDLSNFAISPSDGDGEATIIPIRSTAFSSQTPTAFSREPSRRELADTTADPDPDPDLESTPTQRALHRPNCSSLGDLEVIEKAASKNHGNENRASGDYLLKLLDSCDFDEGLAKEFKAMINMVKHINSLLFHGSHGPGEQIGPHRLRQIESVAEQVMHYFAKLGDKFDADLCRINEVRKGLPSLGHDVKPTFLRTNLNVWNLKIMQYV